MSSDQQVNINSLSLKLSESLGLEGGDTGGGDEGACAGSGAVLTDPPLLENAQSQEEPQPDNNNTTESSTMNTLNNSNTNQLPSLVSVPSSPTLSTSLSDSHNRQFTSPTSSVSSSASASPLHHVKNTNIFDEEYSMNRPNRGLCLIFNHEDFVHVNKREGTDYDAYRLRDCFEHHGFNIVVHKDLNADEVNSVLTEVAAANHSDSDCLVCCFLTHGDEESLHARDITYYKRDIFNLFTAEKCPSLKGKPKIFIIQACRGTKVDRGVSLEYQTDAASITNAEPVNRAQTLPIWADFLISYSTVEGYFSYRNTSIGGPFIQALVPHLEQYGAHYDLVSILTCVNREVGFYEAMNEKQEIGKQIPQMVCTLTKKVIFRRKPNQSVIESTISYRNELHNRINAQKGASNNPKRD